MRGVSWAADPPAACGHGPAELGHRQCCPPRRPPRSRPGSPRRRQVPLLPGESQVSFLKLLGAGPSPALCRGPSPGSGSPSHPRVGSQPSASRVPWSPRRTLPSKEEPGPSQPCLADSCGSRAPRRWDPLLVCPALASCVHHTSPPQAAQAEAAAATAGRPGPVCRAPSGAARCWDGPMTGTGGARVRVCLGPGRLPPCPLSARERPPHGDRAQADVMAAAGGTSAGRGGRARAHARAGRPDSVRPAVPPRAVRASVTHSRHRGGRRLVCR